MGQRYILVEAVSTGMKAEFDNFINRVNEKIDEGYEPCGNLLIETKQSISGKIKIYTQPMFKRSK